MQISFNATTGINVLIYHMDNSMIVYESFVRPCDVAIWVRMDFYSHYETDQCTGANHWLNLDAHAPPDHGGHVYNDRGDVGNYSWVALTGKYDSGDILAPDDELEKTGTYALCFARWNGEPNCTTWVPHPDNYTFMPDVQIHVRFSRSNPAFLTDTHTHAHTHALL